MLIVFFLILCHTGATDTRDIKGYLTLDLTDNDNTLKLIGIMKIYSTNNIIK